MASRFSAFDTVLLVTAGVSPDVKASSDAVGVVDLETGAYTELVQGILGRYAASGHLVYVRYDGTLMAVPFDQEALVLTGEAEPLPLPGGVGVLNWDFALSSSGRMVYVREQETGTDVRGLVWVDREGNAEPMATSQKRLGDRPVARLRPTRQRIPPMPQPTHPSPAPQS